jgi:hypothetical protein
MLNFKNSPFLRTVAVPITLLSFLSACHKWSTVKDPVAQTLNAKRPPEVRVTNTDGTLLMVHNPSVADDTLSGYSTELTSATRIALHDISKIEISARSAGSQAPRWLPVDPPFELSLPKSGADLVRVTEVDGRVIQIENPTIEGTDLAGQARTARAVTIPLEDVARIEQRTANTPATVALVAVAAGAVFFTAFAVAYASDPY